jgi:transposase
LEQLVLRVSGGEPLEKVNEELGLKVEQKQVAEIEAKYEAGGRKWEVLIDGRYGHGQKVHSGIREWLYKREEGDQEVRAPQLACEIKDKFDVEVESGHLNYLLRERGLSVPVGWSDKEEGEGEEKKEPKPDVSKDNAGIFFPGRGEGSVGGGRSDRRERSEQSG